MSKMIGMGMVLASSDEGGARHTHKARAACANFFADNGISPPGPLFDNLGDTFYFA
ncbi:hypothetical protein [Massilia glaciei]|uniref:hypothetical protein n=1 Tax=Massilia glaciei TaxID=1524097 RepID=UPI0015E7E7A7|nr:hypothetical protein [Massilia glaciei]